jgi:hypothetical protein
LRWTSIDLNRSMERTQTNSRDKEGGTSNRNLPNMGVKNDRCARGNGMNKDRNTKRHRRRTGSQRGSGESVVHTSEGTGRRSLAASPSSRQTHATESRTDDPGSGSLRMSRTHLDHSAGRRDDPAAVRCQRSSRPWLLPSSPHHTPSAQAHPEGDPTRGDRTCGLERGTVACAQQADERLCPSVRFVSVADGRVHRRACGQDTGLEHHADP